MSSWPIAAWLMLGGSTLLLFMGMPVALTFLGVNIIGAVLYMGGEPGLVQLVPGLQYSNVYDRGFMLLNITQDTMRCDWIYIDNILSDTAALLPERQQSASVNWLSDSAPRLTLQA